MLRHINLQLFATNGGPELSVYDQYNLNESDKSAMLDIKNRTLADPANTSQYHQLAEDIRAKYGYSGGNDGFQYVKLNTNMNPNTPEIPTFDDYQSNYNDLINQSLNNVINAQFSYNPDTDPAYQAYLKKATRLGEEAFANNIGALSSTTGGRLNSWAATAASRAREDYAMQAAEAVGTFEDKAYSRFVDQRNQNIDILGLVMNLDERDYSRYRDKINNTLDNYQMELDQYKLSIDQRKNDIEEAMNRTKLQGYVSNDDSVLLGVPPGTLSYEAESRILDMQDWITQQEKQLEFDQKQLDMEYNYEAKLLSLKSSYDTSGSTKTKSYDGDPENDKRTTTDANKRDSEIEDFKKYTSSDEFKKMTADKKMLYFNDKIDQILDDNAHGILADWVADAILTEITNSKEYKDAKASVQNFINLIPSITGQSNLLP